MNTYIREIVDKTNLLQSYQSEEGTLINVENRDRVRTILCDIVNNIEELIILLFKIIIPILFSFFPILRQLLKILYFHPNFHRHIFSSNLQLHLF